MITPNRKQCRDCNFFLAVNDDNYYDDCWHYYCKASRYKYQMGEFEIESNECIDGFYLENGECEKYENS